MKIHSRENWIIDNDNDVAQQNVNESKEDGESVVSKQIDTAEAIDNLGSKRKIEETFVENKKAKAENDVKLSYDNIQNPVEYDENCWECKETYRDPPRDKLIMYLHALSYKVCFIF